MQKLISFFKHPWGPFLALTPLLIDWLYYTLNASYWFPADPGAWYFLDSLAIFNGQTYTYVDHPGTPVHLIGSFLLALTYPFFENRAAFLNYHIARPETFFLMANLFLLALNSFTAILFYQTVRAEFKRDGVLTGLTLSLLFFGLHPQSFESLTFWSHNSFNYPFGTLWLLWLYRELRSNQPPSWKKLALLGFSAGAMGMTQMYFFAWLAAGTLTLLIFFLRLGKTPLQALAASGWMGFCGLLGVLAMLAPIQREVPRFIHWFWRILTNTGVYGSGASGFYTLEMIHQSLGFWLQNAPVLMAAILLALGLLGQMLRSRPHLSAADQAMLVGLLTQTALLLLVLSKLYAKLRYTLSLAAVLPVLIFILLKVLPTNSAIWTGLKRALFAITLGAVAFNLSSALITQTKKAFVQRDAALARSLVVTNLAQNRGVAENEIVVVYGSGTPIKCAGLLMANAWIRAFDTQISALCPNQYAIYDSVVEIKINTNQSIPQLDELAWDVVVAPGNHSGLQDQLRAQGAVNVPRAWGVNRGAWFFIHAP